MSAPRPSRATPPGLALRRRRGCSGSTGCIDWCRPESLAPSCRRRQDRSADLSVRHHTPASGGEAPCRGAPPRPPATASPRTTQVACVETVRAPWPAPSPPSRCELSWCTPAAALARLSPRPGTAGSFLSAESGQRGRLREAGRPAGPWPPGSSTRLQLRQPARRSRHLPSPCSIRCDAPGASAAPCRSRSVRVECGFSARFRDLRHWWPRSAGERSPRTQRSSAAERSPSGPSDRPAARCVVTVFGSARGTACAICARSVRGP